MGNYHQKRGKGESPLFRGNGERLITSYGSSIQPYWWCSPRASSPRTAWPGPLAYSIVQITSYPSIIPDGGLSLIHNNTAISSIIEIPGNEPPYEVLES